jgi:hypothetical protein
VHRNDDYSRAPGVVGITRAPRFRNPQRVDGGEHVFIVER